MLQGIQCIQSVSIATCSMDSTASNLDTLPQAACNPLHSLGMHFTMLHVIQCIQSCRMESTALKQDPFGQAACNPLHSLWMHFTLLHGIHCIQSVSITPSCMEATSIIEIHCTTLHKIHCIQSRCMESTAFNRDPLGHTAWNPLHSLRIHFKTLH